MDSLRAIQDLRPLDVVQAVVAEAALRPVRVLLAQVPGADDADRLPEGRRRLERLKHAPRILGRRLVFTIGTAVPYGVALVDVAVVVAAGQHDRVDALPSFAVDTALRRAVRAVADGAELRGPPLPVDEVALAVEVGELTPGEVAVDAVGVALVLLAPLPRLDDATEEICVEDLHDPPAVQLLGVRTNVPGVHDALAVLWVKDFRKTSSVVQ